MPGTRLHCVADGQARRGFEIRSRHKHRSLAVMHPEYTGQQNGKNKKCMTEKVILLTFSIVIIFLYGLNFNDKWTNKNYEQLNSKNGTWFWFRTFKIEETKENYVRFIRGISVFVISIMIVSIIATLRLL